MAVRTRPSDYAGAGGDEGVASARDGPPWARRSGTVRRTAARQDWTIDVGSASRYAPLRPSQPTKRSCSLRSRAWACRPEKRILPRSDLGSRSPASRTRRACGGREERAHAPTSPCRPGGGELTPEAVGHLARHVDGLCCFSCSNGRVPARGSPALGLLDAGDRMAASGRALPAARGWTNGRSRHANAAFRAAGTPPATADRNAHRLARVSAWISNRVRHQPNPTVPMPPRRTRPVRR